MTTTPSECVRETKFLGNQQPNKQQKIAKLCISQIPYSLRTQKTNKSMTTKPASLYCRQRSHGKVLQSNKLYYPFTALSLHFATKTHKPIWGLSELSWIRAAAAPIEEASVGQLFWVFFLFENPLRILDFVSHTNFLSGNSMALSCDFRSSLFDELSCIMLIQNLVMYLFVHEVIFICFWWLASCGLLRNVIGK